MFRRRLAPFLALCALVLISAGVQPASADPASLLHKPAPRFTLPDLDHHPIDLSAYRGKVVLLTFWATWCAPCQVEMPHFIAWQTQDGPAGLQIIAISMDDDAAPVAKLVRRRGVNYPVAMGNAKLAEAYGGVMGLPVTFLIDRKGTVAAVFKGESNLQSIRSRVLSLLRAH